jgi:hypothetical protein
MITAGGSSAPNRQDIRHTIWRIKTVILFAICHSITLPLLAPSFLSV